MLLGVTCLTAELLAFKRTIIATKKRFETGRSAACDATESQRPTCPLFLDVQFQRPALAGSLKKGEMIGQLSRGSRCLHVQRPPECRHVGASKCLLLSFELFLEHRRCLVEFSLIPRGISEIVLHLRGHFSVCADCTFPFSSRAAILKETG